MSSSGIANANLVGGSEVAGLWVGGFNSPRSEAALRSTGITHVLSAAREFPPPACVDSLHLQLNDETHWDLLRLLPQALPWIHAALTADGGCNQVLVHCAHGSSRSGSLAVAYLMWRLRLSFDEALALAQQGRPKIQPNPGFEEQLRYWHASCGCQLDPLLTPDANTAEFMAQYRQKAAIVEAKKTV